MVIMAYKNFYNLKFREKKADIKFKLYDQFDNLESFLKRKEREALPLHLSYLKGKYLKDILCLGAVGVFGYSPRMIEVIKKADATGIQFYPLNIEGPDEIIQSLVNYQGAFITGTSGPIIRTKSKYKLRPAQANPNVKIPWEIGRFFNLNTWDGSDFFNPEGTLYTFVTSRIVELLSAIKPSSVSFITIDEIENIISLSMIPNDAQIEPD
jgi:hypothetical protein